MPKRLIDSSMNNSPSMEVLSPRAQDAFPRFITCADDFGCFEIDTAMLKLQGWPKRPDVTPEEIASWVYEYATKAAPGEPPIAMTWTARGRRYCHLTGWFGEHGQRKRDEYHPEKNRKGSKRRTPAPPADLLAAVMAGERRASDGLPPGSDVFPPGKTDPPERENSSNSTPAREIEFPADSRRVPAAFPPFPAHAVAVAVAVPGASKKLAPAAPSQGFRAVQSALVAAYREVRGEPYLWQKAKDTEGLKRVLVLNVPLPEILDRWRAGLTNTGWASCSTVAQLAAKWNDLAGGVDPYEARMRRIRDEAERNLDRPRPGDGGEPEAAPESAPPGDPLPAFGATVSSAVGELLGHRGTSGGVQDRVPMEPRAEPRGAEAPRTVREP